MKIKVIRVTTFIIGFVAIVFALFIVGSVISSQLIDTKSPNIGRYQDRFIIINAKMINVLNGQLSAVDIEVSNERIKSISPAGSISTKNAVIFDVEGRYITPGLIDAHVHIFDHKDLAGYLRYGVTSVRNMMGFPVHLSWKKEILNHTLLGPNLVTASPTINAGDSGGPFHKIISTDDELESALKQYQADGYDFYKFYDGLNEQQFLKLVEVAHALQMPYAGHVPQSIPFNKLLALAPTSIEHVEELFNTQLKYKFNKVQAQVIVDQLAASHVPIVPTLIAFHNIYLAGIDYEDFITEERLNSVNSFVAWIGKRMLEKAEHPEHIKYLVNKDNFLLEITSMLFKSGAEMALGTDTGPALTQAGRALHEEIQLLQSAGIDNLSIIKMATVNAAKLLNVAHITGLIEQESYADLLVLDVNPLENITTLSQPFAVISRGRIFENGDLKLLEIESQQHTSFFATVGLFVTHWLAL